MPDEPPLLRIPSVSRSVDELLGVAGKMHLPNAILLSERADGSLVFLTTDMSLAEANWLVDRLKMVLLGPHPEHCP
jgi:hypothetical protein